MTFLFISVFGLIIGSFLSAITWRIPRGVNFVNDRSRCDDCGSTIYWYDNIPLFSYLRLKGKCRNCGKKVSLRYPLIEFSTALMFVLVYLSYINCFSNAGLPFGQNVVCTFTSGLGYLALPYFFLVTAVLISIFITDLEYQIIPDEFVFLLFVVNLIIFPLFFRESFYVNFFSGFSTAMFLLLLHISTGGRGMGLGDVKLALFGGSFFGLNNSISWIFLSFIVGAVVGLLLILYGKTSFGRKIAFGPFLVISFFLVLFWGESISFVLIPYLR